MAVGNFDRWGLLDAYGKVIVNPIKANIIPNPISVTISAAQTSIASGFFITIRRLVVMAVITSTFLCSSMGIETTLIEKAS